MIDFLKKYEMYRHSIQYYILIWKWIKIKIYIFSYEKYIIFNVKLWYMNFYVLLELKKKIRRNKKYKK